MKLPLILALLLPFVASAEERPSVKFKVSEIGRDKSELLRVFFEVQRIEQVASGGLPRSFQIMQRLTKSEFLVHPLRIRVHVIGDSASRMGGGGNVVANEYEEPVISLVYLLNTSSELELADGEFIRQIYAPETGETHAYNSVDGSKKTVRVLRQTAPPPLMTQDEFVAKLKLGRSWTLKDFRNVSCSQCFGDGKLSALQNHARCPDCKGKGGVMMDIVVVW